MSAAAVRGLLERHGLLARRDLGQNFLVDAQLAARLAQFAGVGPADAVLEVGTGLGILTRALAERARRVLTLEVDAGLVRALHTEASLPPNVELRHADALGVELGALARELGPPVRVVANLPYAVASPLLRRLLDVRDQVTDWSVMLQREVAERLWSGPGSRGYGSLGVLHQLTVTIERGPELSPRCFFPVPKVISSFVRLTPRADTPLHPGELPVLERVVRAAFAHRRKTLVNSLRAAWAGAPPVAQLEAELDALGIERKARAESLAPETLLALARALARPANPARGGP